MKKLSKKQNKHLRNLAGEAYERELSFHLDDLRKKFDEWKIGQINVWELSDLIHKFHDGKSRDLYKFYVYGRDYPYQVAYAVQNDYISMEDVEESCREHVQYLIDNLFHKEEDEE